MSGKPRALITGITGQDGFYLTRLLLEKGYEVHGVVRRGQNPDLPVGVGVHLGDLTDPATIYQAITDSDPSEIYNLGAQSHVGASFKEASYTFRATAEPILTILECLRANGGAARGVRVYQASSSEMFGDAPAPQNENSPFRPQSPYAVAKVAAHHTVSLYRKAYGLFVVGGILFNHEGPRRPPSFVTRKITRGVARIFSGNDDSLTLGNLDACRDWGFAGDYVKAMWLMLQQKDPNDYVIATGESHSVKELVEVAFAHAGLDWQKHVVLDPKFIRPAEVDHLIGDASKAKAKLGWTPAVDFKQLIAMMVDADLERYGVHL